MVPSTKVDLNHNKIRRVQDLDELAKVLFLNNTNHQRTFLAIFVELKWAKDQFLTTLEPIADKHGISHRTLQTVRAKMRRLGIIDHVSRFNKKHGYQEGWVFSKRFVKTLLLLAEYIDRFNMRAKATHEQKDRGLYKYL